MEAGGLTVGTSTLHEKVLGSIPMPAHSLTFSVMVFAVQESIYVSIKVSL